MGGAAAVARFIGPLPPRWAPPCPWRALTGLYCPGCGSTRALLALAHGDLPRAFTQNPLLVLSLPLLLGWAAFALVRAWRGQPPAALPRHSATITLVVVVLYFVLRNLPWWPCTLLAPHG
ncbi:MAG: DUF2752 domain-containing protein [Opitutaceae bacterium]